MRVVQCFMGADLRCGHEGLALLARKEKIDVNTLDPGEFVIFVNTAKNKLKLYASNQVVAYLRMDKGRSIDFNVIQEIPRAFTATGKIDYDRLLKARIQKDLGMPKLVRVA